MPNEKQRISTQRRGQSASALSLAGLLFGCLLLLAACTGGQTSSKTGGVTSHQTVRRFVLVSNSLLVQESQEESRAFYQWIALMQRYKGDASQYHLEYINDQQALTSAKDETAFHAALQTLELHIKSIKLHALKAEASDLEKQLSSQVASWSSHHTFYDSYNGVTYQMGYEYGSNGIDGWLQDELASAQTLADYQQVIEDANAFLTNFQAYRTNTHSRTPWNQTHQTDLQLMEHYHFMRQKVVVISLDEQALRIYNDGKLIRAFQVTTGRPEKPSLPGNWIIESKQSPTVFKSDEPKGSPYWYPDTPINYAMLYHSGGYFIHDSWWRADYGPDTQFPHIDSSGDSFSFDGSHGCVNVATPDAAWIYNYVSVNTRVLIY
jgi:hypothetical protein